MLKKRLIFTLLVNGDQFVLSRNFRLQNVGSIDWLRNNYDFSLIANAIDELIVLDVTRGERNAKEFLNVLNMVTKNCFVPISAGGGVGTIQMARQLLRSGSDKIVVNTSIFSNPLFLNEVALEFGEQSIVASVDIKGSSTTGYEVVVNNGTELVRVSARESLLQISELPVGEIYLNSLDRDGTGMGLDLNILELLPITNRKPIILSGGAGNATHLLEGLSNEKVDAVSTANLFNFVGDGLERARNHLLLNGLDLSTWMPTSQLRNHSQ